MTTTPDGTGELVADSRSMLDSARLGPAATAVRVPAGGEVVEVAKQQTPAGHDGEDDGGELPADTSDLPPQQLSEPYSLSPVEYTPAPVEYIPTPVEYTLIPMEAAAGNAEDRPEPPRALPVLPILRTADASTGGGASTDGDAADVPGSQSRRESRQARRQQDADRRARREAAKVAERDAEEARRKERREARRARRPGMGLVLLTLVVGAVAGAGAGYAAAAVSLDRAPSAPAAAAAAPSTSAQAAEVTPAAGAPQGTEGANWVEAVNSSIAPSVVSILVSGPGSSSSGSGVVLDEDGYVLTNAHVVSDTQARQITVRLADGSVLDATLVGRDAVYDIAVLKVSALLPVPGFATGPVVVGQPVAAFGAPLGLYGTVTSGIVSAVSRPVVAAGAGKEEASVVSAIQTDAAINPGNSGGPLVDAAGRVVGVNTAIATLSGSSSGSIGLGFAIPSRTAVRVARELIEKGAATKPLIGVSLGASPDPVRQAGALVEALVAGGPAERAGLLVADVVTAVDGVPTDTPAAVIALVRAADPGQPVTLSVLRDGQEVDVTVTTEDGRGGASSPGASLPPASSTPEATPSKPATPSESATPGAAGSEAGSANEPADLSATPR
jgi:putative serine protease PepD